MFNLEDFGRSGISYGAALTLYDLFYVPMMRGWGLEPWTAMQVGLTVLGCATCIVGAIEWRRLSSDKREKTS